MRFSGVISKFNPNHDRQGRFSTGSTGGSGTKYIDDPTKWGDSGDYVAYRAGDLKTDRGLLSFARTEKYAQAYGTNVEKFIVSVKNPYTVDATGMTPVGAVRKAYMALTGKELKFDSGKRTNKEIWRAADKKMASILEKAGNDALIYKNMGESDELLLVAKNKAQAKSYSEIAKIAVVLKHLQGKHNQKNHAPYKHRNQAWGEKHSLPWKSEYKGKGLAGKYESARKPYDEKAADSVSQAAGTYKEKPPKSQASPEMQVALQAVTSPMGNIEIGALNLAQYVTGKSWNQSTKDPAALEAAIKDYAQGKTWDEISHMSNAEKKLIAGALGINANQSIHTIENNLKAKIEGGQASKVEAHPNEMGKAIKTVTSTYGQFADKHLMAAANKVGLKLEQALADPGKFSAGLQTHLKNMSAADIDGMGVVTAKIYAGALGLSTKGAKSDVIAAIKAKMAGEDIPAPKAKTPKQALDETVQATGTKGKAAAKTAASVLAADKKPDGAPKDVVSTIPDPKNLKKVPGNLGGTGEKHLYEDADGNQYMFKPAQTKQGVKEPFRADIQEAASKLSLMLKDNPLDTVEVKKVTINGQEGTLQKVLPATGNIQGKSVKNMTDKQRQQLLEEHTVDWLLGNFDGHSGQFLQMRNGRLVGVDKDQSFRFIDDPKAKKMSLDYDPNGVTPVYNTLFKGHKSGDFTLDLDGVGKMVKRVENIPDKTYRENFRSYAEGIHGKGAKAEALLDKIVARKNSLRSDYEEFFGKTLGVKNADGTPFKFADTAAAPKGAKKTPDAIKVTHGDGAPEPFKGKTAADIAKKGSIYYKTVLEQATPEQLKALGKELKISASGTDDIKQKVLNHYNQLAGKDADKLVPSKADLLTLNKKAIESMAAKSGLVTPGDYHPKASMIDMLASHYATGGNPIKAVTAATPTGLAAKKVTDLKAMAQAKGIKGYSGMTKEQLIAALSGGVANKVTPSHTAKIEMKNGVPHFQGQKIVTEKGEYLGSVVGSVLGKGSNQTIKNQDSAWDTKAFETGHKIDMLKKYVTANGMKVTDAQIKQAVHGMETFTASQYGAIRRAQGKAKNGEPLDTSEKKYLKLGQGADAFIEMGPKWNSNGPIYRKIKVSSTNINDFLAKHQPGNIVNQLDGVSSWTTNEGIWSGNIKFVMKGGTMSGTPVDKVSSCKGEMEVMMHSGAMQRVDQVIKTGTNSYEIHVTEIPPLTSPPTGFTKADVVHLTHAKEGDTMNVKKGKQKEFQPDSGVKVFDFATQKWYKFEATEGKTLTNEYGMKHDNGMTAEELAEANRPKKEK